MRTRRVSVEAATVQAERRNVTIPSDYAERVYAGVLGKVIGVYLGRPVEGWTYERIAQEIGEVDGFVRATNGAPLVVSDDDISGTFTFLRTLEDEGYPDAPTPEQIGRNWLNYAIEGRTIFWWGGVGHSTEHTAFTRLKQGIPAPESRLGTSRMARTLSVTSSPVRPSPRVAARTSAPPS